MQMKQYQYYYRVSKYNPSFRKDGKYAKNEWTSYSDIGGSFDGYVLTRKDYLRIEEQYIRFVLDLVDIGKCNELKIVYFESSRDSIWKVGQTFSNKEVLIDFLRDCMREKCWGQLEDDNLLFEPGYDFYIHIGCNLPQEVVRIIAVKNQLFLESWEPFAPVRTQENE